MILSAVSLDISSRRPVAILIATGACIACLSLPLFGEYRPEAPAATVRASALDNPPAASWQKIESTYFTICYRPGADLKAIERRLRRHVFFFGSSADTDELADTDQRLAHRLDALYSRARDILGMYPRNVHITIKIFPDSESLEKEYFTIFHRHEDPESFYVHQHQTIYTTEDSISDSVMIHEMAHAIIDNYFGVVPPEKIRELIASYVDEQSE